MAVHPATIKRQVRGGIAFGLTAALKSSITIKKGRVEQSNFHDFPLLRYDEMPEIRVLIVRSDQPPTGVGEIGVPVAAPAVVNAVFAATGKRIRHLPVFPQDLA
jgi:CO/xanthine dehydrogenase Mo-binding subunit